MNKKIKIKGKNLEYKLQRRRRTHSIRLAIYPDGNFVITAPRWYPLYVINRFIEEKSDWIFDRLKSINFNELSRKKSEDSLKYKEHRELAKSAIKQRLDFFNQHYKFSYNRISVKNQKTCWGSCSQKGNLNYNYRIASLPADLQDYVIVHELCHLKELNHSQNFWRLVSETVPDYRARRIKLKEKSKKL